MSRHFKNIFDTSELQPKAVVAKHATTAADGKIYQIEDFYLDAIISVGYRVDASQATRFRQWATLVLRDHLTRGYSVNDHRMAQQRRVLSLVWKELEITISNLIAGFETPYGMELISSVHWVGKHDEPTADSATVAAQSVQSWNERKRGLFQAHHVRVAWERLEEQHWL